MKFKSPSHLLSFMTFAILSVVTLIGAFFNTLHVFTFLMCLTMSYTIYKHF